MTFFCPAGIKKSEQSDTKLAPMCKGWSKSISSSSHDFQQTHLPAIWPAAHLRRTSVFVKGENLGAGAIHLPRAFEIPKDGGRLRRPGPKKKDMTIGHVFLFGAADGSRTHLCSLGSCRSTDELQPRMDYAIHHSTPFSKMQGEKCRLAFFFPLRHESRPALISI